MTAADTRPPLRLVPATAEVVEPGRLVASPEPAVVFASLAWWSANSLCDECSVDLVDGGHEGRRAAYRLTQPSEARITGGLDRLGSRAARHPAHVACVRFAHECLSTVPPKSGGSFDGTVTFVWHLRAADRDDRLLAAVLVEHAVRTVLWQRAEEQREALAADLRRRVGLRMRS